MNGQDVHTQLPTKLTQYLIHFITDRHRLTNKRQLLQPFISVVHNVQHGPHLAHNVQEKHQKYNMKLYALQIIHLLS